MPSEPTAATTQGWKRIIRMTRVADPEVHEIAKTALFPKEAESNG